MQTTSATPCQPVRHRILWATALILWGAALYGVLQIHQLSGSHPIGPLVWLGLTEHTICGPWGCGPPVEALVSYHGFWLVLLLPIGWWAGKARLASGSGQAASSLRLGGLSLISISLLVLTAIVTIDAARWLATSHTSSYLFQRTMFCVITLVDLPLIPLTCVGLIWLRQGARDRRSEVEGESSEVRIQSFP